MQNTQSLVYLIVYSQSNLYVTIMSIEFIIDGFSKSATSHLFYDLSNRKSQSNQIKKTQSYCEPAPFLTSVKTA